MLRDVRIFDGTDWVPLNLDAIQHGSALPTPLAVGQMFFLDTTQKLYHAVTLDAWDIVPFIERGHDILTWGRSLWRPVGRPTKNPNNPLLTPEGGASMPQPIEDADGSLRLYFLEGVMLRMAISTDGGETFGAPTTISTAFGQNVYAYSIMRDMIETNAARRYKLWTWNADSGETMMQVSATGLSDSWTQLGMCKFGALDRKRLDSVTRDGGSYVSLVGSGWDYFMVYRSHDGLKWDDIAPVTVMEYSTTSWQPPILVGATPSEIVAQSGVEPEEQEYALYPPFDWCDSWTDSPGLNGSATCAVIDPGNALTYNAAVDMYADRVNYLAEFRFKIDVGGADQTDIAADFGLWRADDLIVLANGRAFLSDFDTTLATLDLANEHTVSASISGDRFTVTIDGTLHDNGGAGYPVAGTGSGIVLASGASSTLRLDDLNYRCSPVPDPVAWEGGFIGYASMVWLLGNWYISYTGTTQDATQSFIGLAMGGRYAAETFARDPANPILYATETWEGASVRGMMFPALIYHRDHVLVFFNNADQLAIGSASWKVTL